ncbi:MAG: thioredoxin family protein [Myxococcales bacterium]|nr:thioredoxin family protein [Myxococcales bacterium]
MPSILELSIMLLALLGAGVVVMIFRRGSAGPEATPQLAPSRDRAPAAMPAGPGKHAVVELHPGVPLTEQLRHHATEAELQGLRPYVEFGAGWCPPSRMFGEILSDPRMIAALAGTYLLRADIDAFAEDPLLRTLRVSAVPVFFELDAEGRATGRSITGAAWGADTVDNMAAAMTKFMA